MAKNSSYKSLLCFSLIFFLIWLSLPYFPAQAASEPFRSNFRPDWQRTLPITSLNQSANSDIAGFQEKQDSPLSLATGSGISEGVSYLTIEPQGTDLQSAKTFVRQLALAQDWNFDRDSSNLLFATSATNEADMEAIVVSPNVYQIGFKVELNGVLRDVTYQVSYLSVTDYHFWVEIELPDNGKEVLIKTRYEQYHSLGNYYSNTSSAFYNHQILSGDIDQDGDVDSADRNALVSLMSLSKENACAGQSLEFCNIFYTADIFNPNYRSADIDQDGDIDSIDLKVLDQNLTSDGGALMFNALTRRDYDATGKLIGQSGTLTPDNPLTGQTEYDFQYTVDGSGNVVNTKIVFDEIEGIPLDSPHEWYAEAGNILPDEWGIVTFPRTFDLKEASPLSVINSNTTALWPQSHDLETIGAAFAIAGDVFQYDLSNGSSAGITYDYSKIFSEGFDVRNGLAIGFRVIKNGQAATNQVRLVLEDQSAAVGSLVIQGLSGQPTNFIISSYELQTLGIDLMHVLKVRVEIDDTLAQTNSSGAIEVKFDPLKSNLPVADSAVSAFDASVGASDSNEAISVFGFDPRVWRAVFKIYSDSGTPVVFTNPDQFELPSSGTLNLADDGMTFTYTPNPEEHIDTTIYYKICDAAQVCETHYFSLLMDQAQSRLPDDSSATAEVLDQLNIQAASEAHELWVSMLGSHVTPGTEADYNGDGLVNYEDLFEILNFYGPALSQSILIGDGNADGMVNQDDYNVWRSNFGKIGTAGAVSGDYNRDGKVDSADYLVWRKNQSANLWRFIVAGDGDGNGIVDQADYNAWRANSGKTGKPGILTGDYNWDGNVDGADYVVWRKASRNNVIAGMGAEEEANQAESEVYYFEDPTVGISSLVGNLEAALLEVAVKGAVYIYVYNKIKKDNQCDGINTTVGPFVLGTRTEISGILTPAAISYPGLKGELSVTQLPNKPNGDLYFKVTGSLPGEKYEVKDNAAGINSDAKVDVTGIEYYFVIKPKPGTTNNPDGSKVSIDTSVKSKADVHVIVNRTFKQPTPPPATNRKYATGSEHHTLKAFIVDYDPPGPGAWGGLYLKTNEYRGNASVRMMGDSVYSEDTSASLDRDYSVRAKVPQNILRKKSGNRGVSVKQSQPNGGSVTSFEMDIWSGQPQIPSHEFDHSVTETKDSIGGMQFKGTVIKHVDRKFNRNDYLGQLTNELDMLNNVEKYFDLKSTKREKSKETTEYDPETFNEIKNEKNTEKDTETESTTSKEKSSSLRLSDSKTKVAYLEDTNSNFHLAGSFEDSDFVCSTKKRSNTSSGQLLLDENKCQNHRDQTHYGVTDWVDFSQKTYAENGTQIGDRTFNRNTEFDASGAPHALSASSTDYGTLSISWHADGGPVIFVILDIPSLIWPASPDQVNGRFDQFEAEEASFFGSAGPYPEVPSDYGVAFVPRA